MTVGCNKTEGQTAIVAEVRTNVPSDCMTFLVMAGDTVLVRETQARPEWRQGPQSRPARVLLYPGGNVQGTVRLQASAHRGGCARPRVAESPVSEVSFVEGQVVQTSLDLHVIGTDRDQDGFAGTGALAGVDLDCDDDAPDRFPGSLERCNGLDDDCNGSVDETCACTDSRPCYPPGFPTATRGKGECHDGTQACRNGRFDECDGEQGPTPEQCDRLDNDCDGETDSADCPCLAGDTLRGCYEVGPAASAGKGECLTGEQHCGADGTYGACTGDLPPAQEFCDGKDNDCDGQTDEVGGTSLPACENQKGVCSGAVASCTAGHVVIPCTGGDYARAAQVNGAVYTPADEGTTCDGKDNDCDGAVDEGCGCLRAGDQEACYSLGLGHASASHLPCKTGTRTCGTDLKWGGCEGEVIPGVEVCDGLDNDCDGQTDETAPGIGDPCDSGLLGVCASGSKACRNGAPACDPRFQPSDEQCDGKDNDCDGQTDELWNKASDPLHCGGLAEACRVCATGEDCCGGRCFNLNTEAAHCGSCARACAAGEACCTGRCADLTSDRDNCNACDHSCVTATTDVCRVSTCVPQEELDCGDGLDEDRDGATDCTDPGCDLQYCTTDQTKRCRTGGCKIAGESSCLLTSGDEDEDGLFNCDDGDCLGIGCDDKGRVCVVSGGQPRCACAGGEAVERTCDDGNDNDCNGFADCADTRCQGHTGEAACGDGKDNDCDGLADCPDPDCAGLQCSPTRTCQANGECL